MQHLHSTPSPTVTISQQERAFFIAFGERLATLRKAQGLTQVQLADALDASQQAITAHESGQRRVPISSLPLLASTLGVSVEALIGAPGKRGAGKRGPAPKFVMQMLDTVLQQQGG